MIGLNRIIGPPLAPRRRRAKFFAFLIIALTILGELI
jgi:hypothetical protein